MPRAKTALAVIAMALAVCAVSAVDVKVEFDKAFDFKSVRTWSWDAAGPGHVKMARTPEDDPEAMRKRVEPVIVESVTGEMGRRGLQASSSAPDVRVTYYLLLTTTASAQTMGQFLPATTGWGLPPFAPATQSLEIMNQGSLVLDISANGTVIWRGLAQAKIKTDADHKRREELIREAVRDLVRRFPPR
jgi:uncharacterized protein DUF4136